MELFVVGSCYRINNMRKCVSGFTLVELLVVMAIISILTMITVSQFQTARRKANDVSRKGDLNSLSKALHLYFSDYGFFPNATSIEGGAIDLNTLSSWGGSFEDQSVSPPYVYMKKLPKENSAGLPPYCYKVDSLTNPKKFALYAELENKLDKECDRNNDNLPDDTYQCGGRNYCYFTTSSNTSLDTNGNIL